MSGGLSIRIASSIGAFTRDEWSQFSGASRENVRNALQPIRFIRFSEHTRRVRLRRAQDRLAGPSLRLEDANGTVLGAVPCYVKSHSQGEYVFDHGWADAFERAGGSYYPKLQASVPFTPATGPRLLVNRNANAAAVKAALAEGLKQVAERVGVSSAHVTFADDGDMAALEGAGFLRRTDQQFHFLNEGYSTYDDFLATLASRKRKALKKERREALASGITIDWLTGSDLTEASGTIFSPSTWTPAAANGAGRISTANSSRWSASGWLTTCCWSWRSATAATSPARSTSSARTRSTAATGAASRTTRSCISRSAITRRSTSRSPGA